MLIGQNFNSYNVNSKPQVGFQGKLADILKKAGDKEIPGKKSVGDLLNDFSNEVVEKNGKKVKESVGDAFERFTNKVVEKNGKKAAGAKNS